MSTNSKFAVAAGAIAVAIFVTGAAEAAPVDYALNSCPASFTADGTAKLYYNPGTQSAASQCQYLSPFSTAVDFANGVTENNRVNVNDVTGIAATVDGFFGITTWTTTGLDHLDINAKTGAWTIPAGDLDFAGYNYMMVFKDGSGTSLTSFLLNEEASSGLFSTPFVNPPFTGAPAGGKDISHISLYKSVTIRTTNLPVPEPLTLSLFGAGLVGAAAIRRRKRA